MRFLNNLFGRKEKTQQPVETEEQKAAKAQAQKEEEERLAREAAARQKAEEEAAQAAKLQAAITANAEAEKQLGNIIREVQNRLGEAAADADPEKLRLLRQRLGELRAVLEEPVDVLNDLGDYDRKLGETIVMLPLFLNDSELTLPEL